MALQMGGGAGTASVNSPLGRRSDLTIWTPANDIHRQGRLAAVPLLAPPSERSPFPRNKEGSPWAGKASPNPQHKMKPALWEYFYQ